MRTVTMDTHTHTHSLASVKGVWEVVVSLRVHGS